MRKKKSLLSEAQVRRFQSLASIQPIHGMKSRQSLKEQDEFEMEDAEADLGSEEVPEEVEMGPEELEAGDMDEADVELDEELVAKFAEAVATMQEVSDILSGGAPEEDLAGEEMEMGAEEEPIDMDAEEAPPAEEEAPAEEEEEEEMLQEALKGIKYVPSQKEVIKVVAQRVAKRLQEAKRAQARLNKALGKK